MRRSLETTSRKMTVMASFAHPHIQVQLGENNLCLIIFINQLSQAKELQNYATGPRRGCHPERKIQTEMAKYFQPNIESGVDRVYRLDSSHSHKLKIIMLKQFIVKLA